MKGLGGADLGAAGAVETRGCGRASRWRWGSSARAWAAGRRRRRGGGADRAMRSSARWCVNVVCQGGGGAAWPRRGGPRCWLQASERDW